MTYGCELPRRAGRGAMAWVAVAAAALVLAAPALARRVSRSDILELGLRQTDLPSGFRLRKDEPRNLQGTRTQIWYTVKTVLVKPKAAPKPKSGLPDMPIGPTQQPVATYTINVWVESSPSEAEARLKALKSAKARYRSSAPGGAIGNRCYVSSAGKPEVLFRRDNIVAQVQGDSPVKGASVAVAARLARALDARIRQAQR